MLRRAVLAPLMFAVLPAAASVSAEPALVPANISQEAQAWLAEARTGRLPEMDMRDPEMLERMRATLGKMFLRAAREIDPDLYVTQHDLDGVTGYWINSDIPSDPGPVILYLHGGGHILGSATQNLGNAIRVGAASGLPVLSVEYRLAPEFPFPANVDDAVHVYRWLLLNGYEASRIGVYGDSAGGGLSLAMTHAAREAGLPLPGAVAALSPLADLGEHGDTRITLAGFDPVLRTTMRGSNALYLGEANVRDPLVSPVYGDYSAFPPLLIQVGTREQLLSDAVRLAAKARADGADVVLDVWDGMWHGWHDQPGLPEAERACAAVGDFFVRHLGASAE